MQRLAQVCLGFCLSLSSAISTAEPEAVALLERMGTAAKKTELRWRFHLSNGP